MASSTPLSKANTTFSLALFKKLTEDNKTGNVFYSPLSISSALAMVLLGARGNTAAQMLEVLHFLEVHDVHVNFGELMRELNKPDTGYSVSLANRLYWEQSFLFSEEFREKTRRCYDAEMEWLDFETHAEDARVIINTWVEKQTHGKIKDILGIHDVDSSTIIVLVNALYFKSDWENPFNGDHTHDAQFKITKTDTKNVKMMQQISMFPHAFIPEPLCQVLELPYKGKDLSMLIFLPESLEMLESQLTYENFVDWTSAGKMEPQLVAVGLPRFKVEEKYDMKEILKSMGMVDAFDYAKSDFSGMSEVKNLEVSKVIHKAFVEVNEKGTEAAAATAVPIVLTSSGTMPTRFIADHPFLFFIRHNASGSILFAGRVCFPE